MDRKTSVVYLAKRRDRELGENGYVNTYSELAAFTSIQDCEEYLKNVAKDCFHGGYVLDIPGKKVLKTKNFDSFEDPTTTMAKIMFSDGESSMTFFWSELQLFA